MPRVTPQDAAAVESMAGNHAKAPGQDVLYGSSDSDDEVSVDDFLGRLGYESQLPRNRSTVHVAFMAFVLAANPYGLATTLNYPLIGGGPVNIIWGWLLVALIVVCVAASLGEITSVYPTAGGVYHQAGMLSPPEYRPLASWICGWLLLVGNISITLSVNFGTAQFFTACLNVFEKESGTEIFPNQTYQGFLIFVAMTLLCNAVSSFGNRWLPLIDTAAIFWTFIGMFSIAITVLVVAKNGRHSAEYVFGHFETESGWPHAWSFCIGLMHAGYATSSTGMIISMCEEVHKPSIQVPRAMVATAVINTIAGLLFLIPIVFVLPDIKEILRVSAGQPAPMIIKDAVGSSVGAFLLLMPLVALGITCGIGCTTASSRCTWAFARDGAVPGSRWCKEIHPKLQVPLNAMLMCMVIEILLGCIYFGSSVAFSAFSGVGVICLTCSYATPIAISLATGRKHLKGARFQLGKFGYFCNVVSIGWSLLAVPLFCMPSTLPVTSTSINYAPVVFVAATLISSGWYWVRGSKQYRGPAFQEASSL